MPSTTLPLDEPGLRLITVPEAAPPYDCDVHGAACPARDDDLTGADLGDGDPGGGGEAPEPVRPAAAASACVWPRQFAQVLVEILAGARSPRQVVPCTTDRVRANIDVLTPQVAAGQRPRIQRIMMSHPTAHAVEVTVVVSFGPRARALALRCEHLPPRAATPGRPSRPARWLCTELEAG